MQNIEDRNHSIAKILIIIPIILAAIPLFSLIIALVLEGPTKRGAVYAIFMLIVMLGLFLAPPISIILSIIAIVLAIKAIKDFGSSFSSFSVAFSIIISVRA